jgi:hypothetical protein
VANFTLLEIVNAAQAEMSLPVSSTVIGNTAADVVQQRALVNAVGQSLRTQWPWQASVVPYTFTTPSFTYTADLSTASTTITNLSSTTGLTANPTYFQVVGEGVPDDTYLVSVNAGLQTAVLTNTPTATNTAASLTFSQVRFAMPSDFYRLADRTQWDKSQHWEMLGPETAQQWQWLKSGYISTGPRVRYRVLQNLFQIWPALGANHTLGFEYFSKNWIYASASTTLSKQVFSVDTDTCLYPDRLMIVGLKKAYFQAKGFEPVFDAEYAMELDNAKANDAGSPTLSFSPQLSNILIGFENIPDANFGS